MPTLKDFCFLDLLVEEDGWEPEDALEDVEFRVLDNQGDLLGKIKAHKLLLSLLSPVWKNQFFKNRQTKISPDEIEIVEITGPTFTSFVTLIKFIYGGNEDLIKEITDLETLFQLFYLADKYQIQGVKKLIRTVISSVKITGQNYVEVFSVLRKYEKEFVFEEVCEGLYVRCAQSVMKEWKCVDDVIKFWTDNFEDDLEMKNLLMKRIVSEFKNKIKCDNCKELEDDCLDGKPLAKGWKGLKVRTTDAQNQVLPVQGNYYVPIQTKGVVQEFHDQLVQKHCNTFRRSYSLNFSVMWDCPNWQQREAFHAATTGIVYDCK